MKKNYLILRLAAIAIAIIPLTLKAQNSREFKDQYLKQAKDNAAIEAKVTAALLRQKYSGDAAMEKALYKVFYERKLAIEETVVKYGKSPELEARLAEVITKNDSTKEIYLQAAKNKGLINNNVLKANDKSKFASAIRLRRELSLSPLQTDSLMYHTNKLADLLINNPNLYPKDYERQVLPRILSDEQYTNLLVSINTPKALKRAQKDWADLKWRGLLPSADSAQVINDITKNLTGQWSYEDRYDVSPAQVSPTLKAILTPEPEAIKILRTARRYNNPVPAQGAKPAFRW